ncbi:MarR family transcriptional regulator [Sphaerisporangium album]|uniref:MarR family transcriptional regulator n=1 Tax=Sphaerisporangium album TaxID=509200 RepID=A0A367FFW1_9ACTN|nr:MarR family transcriptional regulator [Sphaerisporangium album]RCG28702.1 MarR family transcriptional regulator [Sphaerisporangium album]
MTELADGVVYSRSGLTYQVGLLSHVVGRLERQGWITRVPDPENRRFVRATLTDAGWAKLVDSAPGHVEAVQRHVFDQLTAPQVAHLTSIARKIRSVVAPDGEPGDG